VTALSWFATIWAACGLATLACWITTFIRALRTGEPVYTWREIAALAVQWESLTIAAIIVTGWPPCLLIWVLFQVDERRWV
jgi:hypothetical protein